MALTIRARTGALLITGFLASACSQGLDVDMRGLGADGFDTSDAALASRGAARPAPDSRGVISYPTYQVAVARSGDSVGSVAARVGLPTEELASYNGLAADATLRPGELVALPRRVGTASGGPAGGSITTTPLAPSGDVSVAAIAGPAIERAAATSGAPGSEPQRHRVAAGETAFSISRRYGVAVDSLAALNGLGADRSVRVGQVLLIPPSDRTAAAAPAETARPGQGSPTPVPPSAAQPLPQESVAREVETPPSPNLASGATTASDTTRLLTPVAGRIVRGYSKGQNDGIDIAAPAGSAVRAADEGTVAAVTRDTNGVPIVVVRHEGDLLTVYAGVDDLSVEKGARVSRGQQIARIRGSDPSVLHFEVREGFESVDPSPYLN